MLFCSLGALSTVGARRLSRQSCRDAARRAVEALELPTLPTGARVTLCHKGVAIEGEGTVTETTPGGLRCHVRWAPHLDTHFVYTPRTGGTRRRVKRCPVHGWPRGSLVAVQAAAVTRRAAVAADALTGHWRGTWHEDGATSPRIFPMALELAPEPPAGASPRGTVRLRSPPGMSSARGAVAATVCTATGRVVMEIGGAVAVQGQGRGRHRDDPDVYFNGELDVDAGTDALTMTGTWLAVDGTAGNMALERVAALGAPVPGIPVFSLGGGAGGGISLDWRASQPISSGESSGGGGRDDVEMVAVGVPANPPIFTAIAATPVAPAAPTTPAASPTPTPAAGRYLRNIPTFNSTNHSSFAISILANATTTTVIDPSLCLKPCQPMTHTISIQWEAADGTAVQWEAANCRPMESRGWKPSSNGKPRMEPPSNGKPPPPNETPTHPYSTAPAALGTPHMGGRELGHIHSRASEHGRNWCWRRRRQWRRRWRRRRREYYTCRVAFKVTRRRHHSRPCESSSWWP